jgi:hypothetical protein
VAIRLSKDVGSGGQAAPKLADLDGFRLSLANRVFDGYCPAAQYYVLLAEAVSTFGLDKGLASATLDIELERMRVANEPLLLREMEAMLRQFTGQDKKLDEKERSDLVQLFCKPKIGYSKGLSVKIAQDFIIDFCRKNIIKVKVGFFKWMVP